MGHEIYRRSSYGDAHPLSIPRVSTCVDLCRAMGWLEPGVFRESRPATFDELTRFHHPEYLRALERAEREGALDPETADRFDIGRRGNPIFPEVYRRPVISAGAAIEAAATLVGRPGIVYSPASGTHHARPARASGFCYVNAPVLAIQTLLEGGIEPICYVDLDAHHGDGVEEAFADDARVITLSIHEEGRWPGTGGLEGDAGLMAFNLPVPAGFNDDELAFLIETVVVPLVGAVRPPALVLQTGADGLADDPLSGLALSNRALWSAVATLRGLAPRLLVVGGGGYNPWSVGRAWAGIWATLIGADPDVVPTAAAKDVLAGLSWNRAAGRNPQRRWLETLADLPNHGSVRDRVRHVAGVVRGRLPTD